MVGKKDLLKWFGRREKAFSKYACDFLNLSARGKKQVPVRHPVNEDIMY